MVDILILMAKKFSIVDILIADLLILDLWLAYLSIYS